MFGTDITAILLVSITVYKTHKRKNLSIIPQEPIIFSDTIRGNLDPFGEYDDTRIWNVLQSVGLKNKVSLLPNGLEHILNEGGANLSGRFLD